MSRNLLPFDINPTIFRVVSAFYCKGIADGVDVDDPFAVREYGMAHEDCMGLSLIIDGKLVEATTEQFMTFIVKETSRQGFPMFSRYVYGQASDVILEAICHLCYYNYRRGIKASTRYDKRQATSLYRVYNKKEQYYTCEGIIPMDMWREVLKCQCSEIEMVQKSNGREDSPMPALNRLMTVLATNEDIIKNARTIEEERQHLIISGEL